MCQVDLHVSGLKRSFIRIRLVTASDVNMHGWYWIYVKWIYMWVDWKLVHQDPHSNSMGIEWIRGRVVDQQVSRLKCWITKIRLVTVWILNGYVSWIYMWLDWKLLCQDPHSNSVDIEWICLVDLHVSGWKMLIRPDPLGNSRCFEYVWIILDMCQVDLHMSGLKRWFTKICSVTEIVLSPFCNINQIASNWNIGLSSSRLELCLMQHDFSSWLLVGKS